MDELKQLTEEQKKEIYKIQRKGAFRSAFIGAKFVAGLFVSNIIAIAIAVVFLKDTDPDMIKGFQFVSMAINFIFMMSFLSGQTKDNNDRMNQEIKEVLSKQQEESVDEKR